MHLSLIFTLVGAYSLLPSSSNLSQIHLWYMFCTQSVRWLCRNSIEGGRWRGGSWPALSSPVTPSPTRLSSTSLSTAAATSTSTLPWGFYLQAAKWQRWWNFFVLDDQINFVIKDIIKWNSNFIEKSSPYAWLVMSNVLLISVEDQPNLMRSSRPQKIIQQDRFCCDLRGFGETTCLLFPSAQIMHYALQVCLDSWKLGTKVKQIINILTILSSSSPLSRIIAGLWRRIIHAAMSFQHGRFIEMMRNVTMMLMIVSWCSSSRWE